LFCFFILANEICALGGALASTLLLTANGLTFNKVLKPFWCAGALGANSQSVRNFFRKFLS